MATTAQIDFVQTAPLHHLCRASKAQSDAISGLAEALYQDGQLDDERLALTQVARLVAHFGRTVIKHFGTEFKVKYAGQCALSLNRLYQGDRARYIQLLEWPKPLMVGSGAISQLNVVTVPHTDLSISTAQDQDLLPPPPVPSLEHDYDDE